MRAASIDVIEWGIERVRVGPWRGDPSVAYLSPAAGSPPPSGDFVDRCLRRLESEGFTGVVTGALSPAERVGFETVGFSVSERLHLLAHDLRRLPVGGPHSAALRKARREDDRSLLLIDDLAFDNFWRLGSTGLEEALTATPHTRLMVAMVATPGSGQGELAGYALTGRAARRGYLQRLAVHPRHQGAGIGTALVVDALRWLRRWRTHGVLVNTQLGNERALNLYEGLGFRREPTSLCVLSINLRR